MLALLPITCFIEDYDFLCLSRLLAVGGDVVLALVLVLELELVLVLVMVLGLGLLVLVKVGAVADVALVTVLAAAAAAVAIAAAPVVATAIAVTASVATHVMAGAHTGVGFGDGAAAGGGAVVDGAGVAGAVGGGAAVADVVMAAAPAVVVVAAVVAAAVAVADAITDAIADALVFQLSLLLQLTWLSWSRPTLNSSYAWLLLFTPLEDHREEGGGGGGDREWTRTRGMDMTRTSKTRGPGEQWRRHRYGRDEYCGSSDSCQLCSRLRAATWAVRLCQMSLVVGASDSDESGPLYLGKEVGLPDLVSDSVFRSSDEEDKELILDHVTVDAGSVHLGSEAAVCGPSSEEDTEVILDHVQVDSGRSGTPWATEAPPLVAQSHAHLPRAHLPRATRPRARGPRAQHGKTQPHVATLPIDNSSMDASWPRSKKRAVVAWPRAKKRKAQKHVVVETLDNSPVDMVLSESSDGALGDTSDIDSAKLENVTQTHFGIQVVPAHPYDGVFQWAFRLWIALYAIRGERGMSHVRRSFRLTSYFSGLGTVEVALDCLQVAAACLGLGGFGAESMSACEPSRKCQKVLRKRLDGKCVFSDILDIFSMGSTLRQSVIQEDGRLNFLKAQELVTQRSVGTAFCVGHGQRCRVPSPDIDISGSPCTPWSRMLGATRLRRQHPLTLLLLAWCHLVLCLEIPLGIHENVVGFDVEVVREMLGDSYEVVVLRCSPADWGFEFMARPRVYTLCIRKDKWQITCDIQQTYQEVRHLTRIKHLKGLTPAWPWRASSEQTMAEENRVRVHHHLPPLTSPSADWSYLLTSKQKGYLDHHQKRWQTQHQGVDFSVHPDCVLNLSHGPYVSRASRKQIPTFCRSSSLIWSPHRKRWLLNEEKAAAMGYPVFLDLAGEAGVALDDLVVQGGRTAIGNAMHVSCVGCVFLVALACLTPQS